MRLLSKQAHRIRQSFEGTVIWNILRPARKAYRQVRDFTSSIGKKAQTLKKAKSNKKIAEVDPLTTLRKAKPKNEKRLIKEYEKNRLHKEPDTYVLYRIIGNDLYPRHKKGQSRENLRFILENEPDLENCEKVFVVNRIIDKGEEAAVINLLKKHDYEYVHLPFKANEYKEIGFDTDSLPTRGYLASKEFESMDEEKQSWVIATVYRLKNNYIMNNNGARNTALRDGKKRAKWVLPWDGNCFLTTGAWERIREDVEASPYLKYFAVPMARMLSNDTLLGQGEIPKPVEEPQLLFRRDAKEEFNEEYCYGRRPKVELFWRLGIPGNWDKWKLEAWDQPRLPDSEEAGQFGAAGWVARMFSGVKRLETESKSNLRNRGLARNEAILSTIQHVDAELSGQTPQDLTSFDLKVLDEEVARHKKGKDKKLSSLVDELIKNADEAIERGPYSVIDKTTLPPSGDKQDYWHPAPYWWPNPDTEDGLPYIRKDGERVPGTDMYAPDSEKYDRSRLQRVFDDSTILVLAWKFTGEDKYADHAAQILERFFVNPDTRMNPHLQYSQVRMGHGDNQGNESGIMEMKDFYYYLDAVRIIEETNVLDDKSKSGFRAWLSEYIQWLLESKQGKKERIATNNHGLYYDLQVASIASFLGEKFVLYESLARAQSRIDQHFDTDGSQPEELARTNTAHYCCYNLQGWMNLAVLANNWGVDLWSYKTQNGTGLTKAMDWLLSHMDNEWPYEQIDKFDTQRFIPILINYENKAQSLVSSKVYSKNKYGIKPRFYPHDGIKPYWNIGQQE